MDSVIDDLEEDEEEGDDEEEEDEGEGNSRISSETAGPSSVVKMVQNEEPQLKVPVLKLKVGAGGYVEGGATAGLVGAGGSSVSLDTSCGARLSSTGDLQRLNECSSDVDTTSEAQSFTTTHERPSSGSEEQEDQTSEV